MPSTRRLAGPGDELVGRAQQGNAAAFDELVRQCYPMIYRWALVQMGDADDADDVTQEVLVRLHRGLRSYRRRSRFTTWLYQITRNVGIGLHRARVRQRKRESASKAALDLGGDVAMASAEASHSSDIAELVRTFFAELPPRQRQVFDLADLQGYLPAEIGEMLAMNPVTVRANLCKARRTLRAKILNVYPEYVEELLP